MASTKKPKALLIGGTGAMGVYLSAELAAAGWDVIITSRREHHVEKDEITYIRGNAREYSFLRHVLESRFDVIVDFMVWPTSEFKQVKDWMLASCRQYIYLSSYRVYAEAPVITEDSPRLLDVCKDEGYLATDEYALAKARQEDLLRTSNLNNWTIVRPTVTYSKKRFQLGALEADAWVPRALAGMKVPIVREMLERKTTMTWGGDVAHMIARLCANERAFGEDFNVCTSESVSWNSVAKIYMSYLPFEFECVDQPCYERAVNSPYQVRYDRMFNRVMRNEKVLQAVGMQQSDLMPLGRGLGSEFARFLDSPSFNSFSSRVQGRLDASVGTLQMPWSHQKQFRSSFPSYAKYLYGRLVG